MTIETFSIKGLILLTPKVFADERGSFFESYNQKSWKEAGITANFLQDNQSMSKKGVIRGLHFQKPPFAQAKLVRVIKGAVIDVAVDIRKNSPTYGQHVSVLLSEENHKQFFIPEGFAHGFISLEENTVFAYKCNNYYHKESEASLFYNDPQIGIQWGLDNPIVSQKDLEGEIFETFETPFE